MKYVYNLQNTKVFILKADSSHASCIKCNSTIGIIKEEKTIVYDMDSDLIAITCASCGHTMEDVKKNGSVDENSSAEYFQWASRIWPIIDLKEVELDYIGP